MEAIWRHSGLLLAAPEWGKPKYVLRLILASKFDVYSLDDHSKNDASLDGQLT